MSKTDTDRFDATLAALPNTMAAGYRLGTDAVAAINAWMLRNAGNKAVLGKAMSLGGIHLTMSETEKYTRHLKRGVLLASMTLGGGNPAGIGALKTAIKNEGQTQLRQRLQAFVAAAAPRAAANQIHRAEGGIGTFEFSEGSWQHGNSMDRNKAADSFSKAATLVSRAQSQGIGRLGDPVQKARFERWFGPVTDQARVATVRSTLSRIGAAICDRTVKLYFRGNAKVEGKPTDLPIAEPWSPDGLMHKGDFFGAAWRVQPAAFDQTKTHMMLGSAFFDAVRHGTDSCAGVIIHELSHSEAQTRDHPYPGPGGGTSYGTAKCRWLAANRPALAVTNADNYEFYCEEFWEGVFKANPHAAANPIPDSAKRVVASIL